MKVLFHKCILVEIEEPKAEFSPGGILIPEDAKTQLEYRKAKFHKVGPEMPEDLKKLYDKADILAVVPNYNKRFYTDENTGVKYVNLMHKEVIGILKNK